MRWFWQRRKKAEPSAAAATERTARGSVATAPRPGGASGRLASSAELRDELLRFTRDMLNAQGARVRAEEDDLIVATLPDGSVARYTTTLARARVEEQTTLLSQGAAALETIFEQASQQARMVALRLPATTADPVALARQWLAPLADGLADGCGRCVGHGAVSDGKPGAEPWLAGAPSCDACPLRAGRLALTWEHPPVEARTLGQRDGQSVELVYRLIGRDRRGRRDEWLRLAFDSDGRAVASLSLDLLSAAQPDEAPLPAAASRADLAAVSDRAHTRLRPALDALSALLERLSADEYQRRVEDVAATHERLRRERPAEGKGIEAALARELASLAEVYGVEVEARLESVIRIVSPVAQVAVQTAAGVGPTVAVDVGRGTVSAPVCAVCAADVCAGHVCAQGHAVCATHLESCGQCGVIRCPLCQAAPLTRCALCGDATCDACATACDQCKRTFCGVHAWRCAEGDHTLCLEHLTVCGACGDPLCATHTSLCGACGEARCGKHTRRCMTCGEARCETHADLCVTCGQPLCATHAIGCEQCGKPVCGDDVFTCLGCGRALCGCAGPAACASCGVEYCARCRGETGNCPGCRALEAAGDDDLAALQQAAEREPAINLKRKWQVGRNALARVYIARGLGRDEAWVVTREGDVIGARRKGWRGR